jgi:hypothetical protein
MTPTSLPRALVVALSSFALTACANASSGSSGETAAASSTGSSSPTASAGSSSASATTSAATSATAAAPDSAWRPLIDGSLSAWRGYKETGIPAGWRVEDGVLMKTKAINDLVSREEFQDFELEFDWKIGKGGNAGVFYRGTEEFSKIYYTAPEYQLLDDAGAGDGRNRLTAAASGYALYPAPAGVVKPADQWNSSRIVARGTRIEHWLNGQQVVTYDIGSPDWEAKVRASKFASWTKYGRIPRGRLGIQGDHTGVLAIRGMRIRVL